MMTRLPKLTKEDIEQKITEKKEKIGAGYLTDQSALFLIASDYNCNDAFEPLDTFDENGIHQITGTKFNENGFDKDGNNEDGFNVNGIHQVTGTKFNENGFDKDGYNEDGFNELGFGKDGIHQVTGTKYNEDGKDDQGVSKDAWDSLEVIEKEIMAESEAVNDAEIEEQDKKDDEDDEEEYHNDVDPYTEVEPNCLMSAHEAEAEK